MCEADRELAEMCVCTSQWPEHNNPKCPGLLEELHRILTESGKKS